MRRIEASMQAVLDGEATPEEAREVEARIAADPAVRERFEEMRVVFDALRRVPKVHPPEGLIASVLGALPAAGAPRDGDDQLFAEAGVIRASSRNGRGSRRSKRVFRVFQPWAFPRGTAMNERKNGTSSNRKVMIGGGLAIAAAAVAVSLGIFPPNSSETAGTIVPATRYQAPQPQQVDVGTASGSGSQGTQGGAIGTQAGLQGTQSGLQGTQSGLQGTQSGLQGTQSGLQGTQSGLQGTQSGLQGTQSGLQGTQSGLQGTQSGLQGTQSGLQGTQSGLQGTQSGLQGTQSGLQGTQSGGQQAQIR